MSETIDNNQVTNEEYSGYRLSGGKDDIGMFFSRFFKIISVHKWLFMLTLLVIVALVLLYAIHKPKSYLSSYEVFYNENVREFVSDDANGTVVKSDFDKNYWLRAMQSDEIMRITQKNSGLSSYTSRDLAGMITVGLVDKRKEDRIPVYVVSINSEYKEHIPILIRAYINALNYLLLQNQINNSQNLIAYLNGQINQNNQKLIQMDMQIDNNGSTNSEIVDFDKIKESLSDFRKELMNARVELASVQSARKRTEKELRNLDGTIVNESAFSEPLKVQLMNLEVDLARALTKNKEDHPAVKQIKDNIQQIKYMLKDSLEQRLEIKSLIQNPLKSQLMSKLLEFQIQEVSEETRVKSLEMVISELERKTMPNSVNQDKQQQLRNRELIALTIKQLNDKLIEAQSTSHGSMSRFVYIDDPNSIFLVNRSIWFYLVLALLLGFLIGAIVVFVYDWLDDRIMIHDDFERFYKYPVLGVVRHYNTSEEKAIEESTEYKQKSLGDIGGLVVNLRQVIKHNHIKTMVISSPDRQEGKSLVSMKVASALATKKQRVLLVDMDFYSPKISSKLFVDMPKGLSNYILDEVRIDEIIQSTDIETLKVVVAGDGEGQKDLFYNDTRLITFIDTVKKDFDVIIFDTPAVMYIPDILEFFDIMDSIVVVVRLRRTTRKLLDRIFRTLGGFETKYKGVILNDMHSSEKNYYSNYEYGYTYDNYVESTGTKKGKKKRPVKSILFVLLALLLLLFFAYRLGVFKQFPINLFPDNRNAAASAIPDTLPADTLPVFQTDTLTHDSIQAENTDSLVVTADTRLQVVALQKYGKKCFWVYIYLANKTIIKNPDKLEEGIVLYLPDPKTYDIDANNPESVSKALKVEKDLKESNLN